MVMPQWCHPVAGRHHRTAGSRPSSPGPTVVATLAGLGDVGQRSDAGPDEDPRRKVEQPAELPRGRQARPEFPHHLRLADAPKTVSGKVRTVELREAAARELAAG